MILTEHWSNRPLLSNSAIKRGARSFASLLPGAPSGTRTPNPLIKSQVLRLASTGSAGGLRRSDRCQASGGGLRCGVCAFPFPTQAAVRLLLAGKRRRYKGAEDAVRGAGGEPPLVVEHVLDIVHSHALLLNVPLDDDHRGAHRQRGC